MCRIFLLGKQIQQQKHCRRGAAAGSLLSLTFLGLCFLFLGRKGCGYLSLSIHTYHLLSLLYAAGGKFFHFFCTDRGFYVMIKKIEKIEVEMIGVYEKGTTGTELPYIGVP